MLEEFNGPGDGDLDGASEVDMSALAECLHVHGGLGAALVCLREAGWNKGRVQNPLRDPAHPDGCSPAGTLGQTS